MTAKDALGSDVTVLPSFYNEDYLHFASAATPSERSDNEAEFIWQALGLSSGCRLVEFGCGFGRISSRLAARGCFVTGVEAVPLLLDHARKVATADGLHIDYQLGTMRDFEPVQRYDAVLIWFYSFGYDDDDGNAAILKAAANALRPGGKLLFDHYGVAMLAQAAASGDYSVIDLGESLLLQRPVYDPERSRWGAERIAVRNGAISRASFTCRCYSVPELHTILTKAGFGNIAVYGDGFAPLSIKSTRMIVLAEKP